MKNKRLIGLLLAFLPLLLVAQPGGQAGGTGVYELDMSSLMFFVLPFYLLTFAAFACFLHYLIRPKSSAYRWAFILAGLGILGALLVAFQLENILQATFAQVPTEAAAEPEMSQTLQLELRRREFESNMRSMSNFWVIGVPNIAIFGLNFGVWWRRRNRAK